MDNFKPHSFFKQLPLKYPYRPAVMEWGVCVPLLRGPYYFTWSSPISGEQVLMVETRLGKKNHA